jgi:hypothetical protein
MIEGVVGKRGYEAGNRGDFVTPRSVCSDHEAEAVFGEWQRGIDVELGA